MEQPVEANGIAQGREGVGLEGAAGLFGIRCDRSRVQADERRPLLGLSLVGEERVEPTAEPATPEGTGRGWLAHACLLYTSRCV